MDKERLGLTVSAVGAIAFVAALLKFVTGFHPSEALPWFVVLAIGAGLVGLGQRLFTAGRQERFK